MTQENKELLLKELCARLSYRVKVLIPECRQDIATLIGVDDTCFAVKYGKSTFYCPFYINIKPYLRPISSMTEEEVDKLFQILKIDKDSDSEWLKVNDIGIIRLFTEVGKDFYEIAEAFDYLNSIHIDYRGLIPEGLAIEVTKENNPYESKL